MCVFCMLFHIMRSRSGATPYTDNNSQAPLSNETTWPKRGGRTTSHFGDGVSFHCAHTHTHTHRGTHAYTLLHFAGGEAECFGGKVVGAEVGFTPSRSRRSGLVGRRRNGHADGAISSDETGSFYSHIWNALCSAVRSPPLTASAACFKMAARLLFICCWSPPQLSLSARPETRRSPAQPPGTSPSISPLTNGGTGRGSRSVLLCFFHAAVPAVDVELSAVAAAITDVELSVCVCVCVCAPLFFLLFCGKRCSLLGHRRR